MRKRAAGHGRDRIGEVLVLCGLSCGVKQSVYPGISPTDNHRRNSAARPICKLLSVSLQAAKAAETRRAPAKPMQRRGRSGFFRKRNAGPTRYRLGTRASANTSGPDLTQALPASCAVEPVKLRTTCDPHRTKKTSFFCWTPLMERTPSSWRSSRLT